LERILASWAL